MAQNKGAGWSHWDAWILFIDDSVAKVGLIVNRSFAFLLYATGFAP